MTSNTAWTAATAEHRAAVARFVDLLQRLPAERWHERAADGRWSAAEEALHVALTYELSVTAVVTGAAMRPRVSPAVALLTRTMLLPIILRTGRFPRGVTAPREVRPPRAEADACSRETLIERLHAAGEAASQALQEGAERRPPVRLGHAYFGPITPLTTLRLLSAHTGHHARRLARDAGSAARG